jgi:hypothetical protein
MTAETVERDLEPRWDGESRPHYESWWTTLHQLNSGAGFRIEYAVIAPPRDPAVLQVAFTSFVSEQRGANVAIVQKYPPDQFRRSDEVSSLQIGSCSLRRGRTTGMLATATAPVTWDLVYEPVTDALRYLPERLYRRAQTQKLTVPFPFMSIGGKIQIGDHRFLLNGDPGQQAHLWSRMEADEWLWFHCSAFVTEAGEPIPGYVSGFATVQKSLPGLPRAPASFGHLVWNERHLAIRPVTPWEERWGGAWHWRGVSEEEDIEVQVTLPWGEMVAARSADTSKARYTHHSQRAGCSIRFKAPRRPPRIFAVAATAHVEIGSVRLDPRAGRVATFE